MIDMRYKIGVIIHYKEMEEKFSHLADQLNCDLFFEIGVMDYAIDVAVELEKKIGVDAIIVSTATADIVKSYVSIPVVPIHIKDYNIVEALLASKQFGTNIAFCDINLNRHYNLQHLSELLDIRIRQYSLPSIYDTENVIDTIVSDGADVVLTPASCMFNTAKRNHLNSVLIRITENDIIDAIESAILTIDFRHREIEKNRWLSSVINQIDECVIATDKNSRITLINKNTCDFLNIEPENVVGVSLSDMQDKFPILAALTREKNSFGITKSENQQQVLVVNREIVRFGSHELGFLYRFTELKDLQKKELRARRKTYENGFFAAHTFDDISGNSPIMRTLKNKALRYAKTSSTILIQGESGSGKEIFAQSIHNASACKKGPFVAINCATFPENLLDSELFGYEEGSFTGAKKGGKEGLFELAHGGTLFLDEIGEMPIHLQSKLLRILQEKSVRRIGGSKSIPISVRIIAATNRNLTELIKEKLFREDLYYRLNVLSLEIPPLRQRKEDIPLLLNNLSLRDCGKENFIGHFTENQLRKITDYEWHGNIRELNNFVERMNALEDEHQVNPENIETLIGELKNQNEESEKPIVPSASDEKHLLIPIDTMEEIEISVISQLLNRYGGNRHHVCYVLDISDTTLWRKIKKIQAKNRSMQ